MTDDDFPDPPAILANMGAAYVGFASYQDHGLVETTFQSGTGNEFKSKVWFTTYFKRPNLFRFAFMMRMMAFGPDMITVIWSDGKSTHVKSPIWPIDKEPSLGMAIAGATGVSSCSAHTVSCMLMPDLVGGHRTTSIKGAEYVTNEQVEGETCDKITKISGSKQSDYWISQSRSVIRRMQDRDVIGPNFSAIMDNERIQVQSFESLFVWFGTKIAGSFAGKMNPMPVTTDTYYQTVVVNEDIPLCVFSEHGRRA